MSDVTRSKAWWCIKGYVAAWTVATALPAVATDLAGVYELRGEREVASAFRLLPDGRFDYFLSYGALDQAASGRWRKEGDHVVLTGDRPIVAPAFELHQARRVEERELVVLVRGPGGQGVAGVDVAVEFDRGEPEIGYTQSYGFSMPLQPDRRVRSVRLSISMHGVASKPFAVDTSKANELTFDFRPNDLGKLDFNGVRLRVEGETMILTRGEQRMRYALVKADK